MRFLNLTGQRFGDLTVTSRAPNRKDSTMWFVRCICGTEKRVASSKLRSGLIASCGGHRTRLLDPVAEKHRLADLRRGYRTRPKVLLYMLYRKQVEASKTRNHSAPPAYTWPEFLDHWIDHPDFLRRYSEWEASGFKNRWLRPSVDRINPCKPYTFDNTHMLNWGENRFKLNMERRLFGSRLNRRNLKVVQLKNGRVIAEYPTQYAAIRATGVLQSCLSAAIAGRIHTAGGFEWRYEQKADAQTSIHKQETQ